MASVVIIGAGSMVFTQTLISDLAQNEATRGIDLRLVDLDSERLATAGEIARRIFAEAGAPGRVSLHLDRTQALPGADYVVITIQVGGRAAVDGDFDIPARYGIRQTVADTLGIGGISRALRTVPVIVDIVADIERLAPEAVVLNYTNPMSMIVMAVHRSSPVTFYGLCHSVPNTAHQLAGYLEVPFDQLDWEAAGINHMSWLLRLERGGQDLYPLLFERSNDPQYFAKDPVRFELMRHIGWFPTESSKHSAEYFAWFVTHDDEIDRLAVPLEDHVSKLDRLQARYRHLREQLTRPDSSLMTPRSGEYAPALIAALENRSELCFYPNVPNAGLVSNLPAHAAVEVPCFVHQGRIHPTAVGDLPQAAAAFNARAVDQQALTVSAVLDTDRDLVYQAALLDPVLSGLLRIDQIVGLVDELIDAQSQWLKPYNPKRLKLQTRS